MMNKDYQFGRPGVVVARLEAFDCTSKYLHIIIITSYTYTVSFQDRVADSPCGAEANARQIIFVRCVLTTFVISQATEGRGLRSPI